MREFSPTIFGFKQKLAAFTTLLFITATAISSFLGPVAEAAVQNPTAAAKISFTFDDGLASAYTQAAPILAKYGLTATDYVITGCVGMTKAPNTCHANTDATYMSWSQVSALQNTYGWEIGSHTVTHPYLASYDASDGQPAPLTDAQVIQEITQSKADLAAHGFNATDFSTPYGDYNNFTLAQIAKVYASHRGFADQNNNDWPYNDYLLNDFQVQEGVRVAQVEAKINAAITNHTWLVLTMHNIKTKPSKNPDDYEYSTKELTQIAAYVKAKQDASLIQSVHVNQGLVTSDVNLLANGSFNDGLADGWHTDDPAAIAADSGDNGSYPDPTNSIKLTSSTTGANVHLFSPKVAVDPNATYMFKNFLNVQNIANGVVAFYVDEYDANGNWISGQYLKQETSAFVEDMNFAYKPTSSAVHQASLQVIVAGTGVTAYLDNSQLFPLTNVSLPPQPTLLSTETFDNGFADGWHTDDPANITPDSSNHGSPSDPVNSVRLQSSTQNTHLFSPIMSVDATKTYSLSSYLNIQQITGAANGGEVAYYVDEYDANGNWISGQYKLGVHTVGASTVSFQYQPSSANVAKASLQVILVGNAGITAYLDDVQVYQD